MEDKRVVEALPPHAADAPVLAESPVGRMECGGRKRSAIRQRCHLPSETVALAENVHPFEDWLLRMNIPFGLSGLSRGSLNERRFRPGQLRAPQVVVLGYLSDERDGFGGDA
jgi:hypothetical protein